MSLISKVTHYWKKDENTWTTAFDSVWSADITLSNTSWTTGKINSGLDFNGTNSAWLLPNWIYSRSKMAFWEWINPDSLVGNTFDNPILQQAAQGTDWAFYFALNSSTIRLAYVDTTNTRYNLDISRSTSNGQWILIWFNYDWAWQKSIWVNWVNIWQQSSWWDLKNYSSTPLTLWANNYGSPGFLFDWKIDEWFIANDTLTSAEWLELYNSWAWLQYPFTSESSAWFLMKNF